MKFQFLAGLLLVGVALGQEPKASVDQPTVNLHASQKVENLLLKAEHIVDQSSLTKQQAEVQFQQLKQTWNEADAKGHEADKLVKEAIDLAYAENKLTKDEYNFDPANFTFVAKPKATAKPDDKAKK